MFYLLVLILLLMYVIFMAPKTVQSTVGLISAVVVIAMMIILIIAGAIKLISLPLEYFVGIAMAYLGYLALRDVYRLSARPKPENQPKLTNLLQGIKTILRDKR